MKAIYKYILQPDDVCKIEMPKGAKVIHVHEQRGEICLWAEVDPKITIMEEREFFVYPTGFTFFRS